MMEETWADVLKMQDLEASSATGASWDTSIRDRILAVLKVYPKLSHSMLQCGIGSSLPAKLWRPVLDGLVANGIVAIDHEVHMSGSGRSTSYSIIHLVGEDNGNA